VLDRTLGNWQFNLELIYMNGAPLAMPDAIPVRDPRLRGSAQSLARWFDTCTLLTNGTRANCTSPEAPIAWIQLAPYQLRAYPVYSPNLRAPTVPRTNISLFKTIPLREHMKLEFRAQAYNAFNNKIYGTPNMSLTSAAFGSIVKGFQVNGSRSMEMAARLMF